MCVAIGTRIWTPYGVWWFLLFSTPGGPYGATGGYPYGTPMGFEKERRGSANHQTTKLPNQARASPRRVLPLALRVTPLPEGGKERHLPNRGA